MENLIKRFVKYAKVHTTSNEDSETVPSTEIQKNLGKILVEDLKEIGLSDAYMDDKGYVYATLKSNTDKKLKKIGFIAHMDTSPAASGENVNPQIHRNYDGGDIVVNKEKNIVLSPNEFSILSEKVGKTIITSDGTTLLGADDKAGITEIIEALKYIIENPQIEHSDIKVCFTPDEEVGRGTDNFDVKKFNAKYAYTVDGGDIAEYNYENFNAYSAEIEITGKSIHPGNAKNKMVSAINLAIEFENMLPEDKKPYYTDGYDGFNHLHHLEGNCEKAKLEYIIRNHDLQLAKKQIADFERIKTYLNDKYGYEAIKLTINESYLNMAEIIKENYYIIEKLQTAMKKVGIDGYASPIRGGTDGARLTFMGLPCPNIGTGGENYHGPFEFVSLTMMKQAVEIIKELVKE